MADFDPPFASGGPRRFPTVAEVANGFPCGAADQKLFNFLTYAFQSEIGAVIGAAGIVQSNEDLTQLLQALKTLFKTRLTGNINLYVRPNGNDNNSGLADTAAGAKLTIQAAVDAVLTQYDTTGFKATINVANGTYGPVLLLRSGTTNIEIIGNTGSPGSVVIAGGTQNAVAVSTGSTLSISGVKVTSTAGSGLLAFDRSAIRFSLMEFGACQTAHMYANTAAGIFADGNFTISGNSANALLAGTGSNVSTSGRTVAFVGTPNASVFARANNGTILAEGMTFTGAYGSGQRYLIEVGGTIYTAGAGVNYFPGTTAGTVVNGVYI